MAVEFEVAMIADHVRELSEKEVLSFFRSVPPDGSVGLMGGWAVTYLLKKRRVDHMGSRDIDVFYNPDRIEYASVSDLIRSSGFSPHSTFRWVKYFDARTGKLISEKESKLLQYYDLVIVYLDVAAPSPGESLLGRVLDEALLGEVLAGKGEYWPPVHERTSDASVNSWSWFVTIRSLNRRNTTPVRAFLLFLERLRYAVCERFEDLLKFFLYGFPALQPVECQDEYPDDWQCDSYDADSGDDDENRRDERQQDQKGDSFSNVGE